MRFSRFMIALFVAAAVTASYSQIVSEKAATGKEKKFPVTTSSAAAARYFETGMVHYENHRWNFALRDWREAVALGPEICPGLYMDLFHYH